MAQSSAHAASYKWTGLALLAPTDWFQSANWSPRGVPGSADTADLGALHIVSVSRPVTVSGLTVGLASTLTGAGSVTVTGAATSSGGIFSGSGALIIGPGATFNVNDLLTATVGNVLNKRIVNSGTVTITSLLGITVGGDLVNNAGGLVDIHSDISLALGSGSTATLTNAGTLIKSAGLGISLLSMKVNNSGVINVNSGTLKFGQGCAQSGGSINLNGGDVAGAITLLGGILAGTGKVTGNVYNDAIVGPGHSPGAITINGNYTQTANGTLNMEIAGTSPGTQYDQLIVEGSASLAGTLNISLLNNYAPPTGSSFYLIEYYSYSGRFAAINGVTLGGGRYFSGAYMPSYYLAQVKSDTSAPTVSVASPAANGSYTSLASATGSSADSGGSNIAAVTVALYRYAAGSTPAGYWAGGSSWNPTYNAATNELNATGTASWTFGLPALGTGQYQVRALAKDVAGNATASAVITFTKADTVSSVTLSTASAAVRTNTIILTFTGALNAASAADPARYTVTVNGVQVSLQGAAYTASSYRVTLTLPSGKLTSGASVVAHWSNLTDSTGKTLSGQTSTLTAK